MRGRHSERGETSVTGYAGALSYSWTELGVMGADSRSVQVEDNDQTLHVTVTNVCGQSLQGTVALVLEVPADDRAAERDRPGLRTVDRPVP